MSFSFRSLFQRDASSEERGGTAAPPFGIAHQGLAGSRPLNSSMQPVSTMQSPAGTSPFQMGGNPLFKTTGNEPISAPPINSNAGMSPFNVVGATPTNAPLTVGDVIAYLPPEVVRGGAVPNEQPLSLPPMLLDNALRSGQAALPLFELYRVCPALFQTPISPQDPRLVPLPASKLPGLVARARDEQVRGAEQMPPSEVPAARQSTPPGSPFQMRTASGADPVGTAPAFPTSPFAVGSPGLPSPVTPGGPGGGNSPFSVRPATQSPPSPFEARQAAEPAPEGRMDAPPASNGSPFAALGQQAAPSFEMGGIPPSGSPFAAAVQTMPSPFGAAAPAPTSPPQTISQLFSPKQPGSMAAAPQNGFAPALAQSAPPSNGSPSFVDQSQAPSTQGLAPTASAPSGNGPIKFSFAAVVKGWSAEELGFNAAAVPEWIMTSIPAATLQQPSAAGGCVIELGALIDGVTDVGFRNTLSSARRDLQIKIPQNEVFHALTQSTPQAAGVRTNAGTGNQTMAPPPNAFVVQPGQAVGQVSRIDAVQPSAFAPDAFSAPTPAPQPAQFFAGAHSSATAPFNPSFGAAINPFAPAATKPAESHASASPVPPVANYETPTPGYPQAPLAAMSQSDSPAQAYAGMIKPFGTLQPDSPFASTASAVPQAQVPTAPPAKPFDPFAAAGAFSSTPSGNSGLSSAQLLGQTAPAQPTITSAFAPKPEPEQAQPVPTFFNASPMRQPEPEPFVPAMTVESRPETTPSSTSGSLFGSKPASADVPMFSEARQPEMQPSPKLKPVTTPPKSAQAPGQGKMAAVKHSFLGLAPLDTQTDQLLLRALLGTEENLSAPRVVELLATQVGLSACVCLCAAHVLSHADASNPDAVEFQRQAPDIARQLRGLAPLIGIQGAETFTLNAGGRLLTFCFPGETTVAVLHDDEPSTGLRDKITLIARELARMLS